MDRRYSQGRFYSGMRARGSQQERSDQIVRKYLGRAKMANHAAQSYGGSTGSSVPGESTAIGLEAGGVQRARGEQGRELRKVFEQQGSGGALGARAALRSARPLPLLPEFGD